jgi:hypothetical protein
MRRSHNNPYTGYTIDDWNWEFLKRNTRYRRLYKGVQRLKAWLDNKGFAPVASLTVFGRPFRFERNNRGNGWEWRYQPNGKKPIYLNDLSSPDNPSSRRYKGKLIKELKAVTQINGAMDRHGNSSDSRPFWGYVVSASRIADRRMVLAGYRSADLLTRFLDERALSLRF